MELQRTSSQVDAAAEFFEIVMDYRDPREAVREAISNAFDVHAGLISVIAEVTDYRGQDELVLTFEDNGEGMEVEAPAGKGTPNLKAFFDLGNSSGRGRAEFIGAKGHGTKTFFNSREIELYSWRNGKELYALMDDPRGKLAEGQVPEYDWQLKESKAVGKSGTKILVRGYNQNRAKGFSHDELRDYIYWFTKFGSVERQLGITDSAEKKLALRGIDRSEPNELEFGHRFPEREKHDLKSLRKIDPSAPTKYFVKKWCDSAVPIRGYPHYKLDVVFYIEGDKAKTYSPMIRRQGVEVREGMYKVEERYGLWACKDHIPVQNVTEWISRGQRAAYTKFHAFVNSQHFKLTANRGDVGNTDERLLNAIKDTVVGWFEQKILGDPVYQKYEEELALEVSYRRPEEEEREHRRRKQLALKKRICLKSNDSLLSKRQLEFFEPRQEIEVYALFCMLYALNPEAFGFKVVDYDTRFGYDALVETKVSPGLDRETLRFVEFKKSLERDFNHSFAKLAAVICWECRLPTGDQVKDIRGEVRTLKITRPSSGGGYTKHMLTSDTDERNIEVFVLQEYVREKYKLEFRARA